MQIIEIGSTPISHAAGLPNNAALSVVWRIRTPNSIQNFSLNAVFLFGGATSCCEKAF